MSAPAIVLPLGPGIEIHLDATQAERAWAVLAKTYGETALNERSVSFSGLVLDAGHEFWRSATPSPADVDPAWTSDDAEKALIFYSALRDKAKLFFDLLLDHPGRVIDTTEFNIAYPGKFLNAYSVAGAINGLRKPREAVGRRYPFSNWQAEGESTRYALHPDTAPIFQKARAAVR